MGWEEVNPEGHRGKGGGAVGGGLAANQHAQEQPCHQPGSMPTTENKIDGHAARVKPFLLLDLEDAASGTAKPRCLQYDAEAGMGRRHMFAGNFWEVGGLAGPKLTCTWLRDRPRIGNELQAEVPWKILWSTHVA